MDEVFVHQLFHYYNWSGDTELVLEMWPQRVERNLRFRKRTLDPDNDGLYTNVLNTWELPEKVRFAIETPLVREVLLLIAGTTFPMQSHMANVQVVLHYQDGSPEATDLINPYNYDDGIGSFGDHHYSRNEMVGLGKNTHADIVSLPADRHKWLTAVEVCCLSDQILFGILSMTLRRDG